MALQVRKSTGLAVLRYVLALRVPPKRRAEFDSVIATNLGAGRAFVTLASAYGAVHELSRAGDEGTARVESSGGAAASVSAVLDLVPVRFAGHGELELLATDGLARLDLLSGFARGEVDRVGADLAKARPARRQRPRAPPTRSRDRRAGGEAQRAPRGAARSEELKKARGPGGLRAGKRLALRERDTPMLEAAGADVEWLRRRAGVFAATARRRLGQVMTPRSNT